MEELVVTSRNIEFIKNFLNRVKSIKFNVTAIVLFYKIVKIGSENKDLHKIISEYVNKYWSGRIKQLDHQTLNIEGNEVSFGVMYFASDLKLVINEEELFNEKETQEEELDFRIDEFTQRGSGWIVLKHKKFDYDYDYEYKGVRHSPYKKYGSSYIPIPDGLKRQRSCINIKNTDNKCFLWCHAAHILHKRKRNVKDAQRVSK